MFIVFNSIFNFFAKSSASFKEDAGLNLDGIATPITFLEDSESTAIVAVKAESIPPEIPTKTFSKLFFST